MPEPLGLTLQSFTTDHLEIKVKNTSGALLDKTLVIELYPPAYLVSAPITEAARKAPTSQKPVGSMRLDGIVSCPAGWSVWAKRETSDSSLVIVLINDVDQDSGEFMATPVTLAAAAEFTIRIPLNPQASRANTEMLYSYLHGVGELDREDGKLELKSGEIKTDPPDVTLTTDYKTPTAVNPGDLVKVIWHIKDGVSATLRGPLPGGNNELPLSTIADEIHKLGDGWIEVRVVGPMTFVLQAQVKKPGATENVQVVRMLSFDTTNHKYSYVATRPDVVLPHGLVQIDWAAWGVKDVTIVVGGHTTRVIPLTQQTLGRFFEGAGVMRVSASKTAEEAVILLAPPLKKESTSISVSTWEKMLKPDFTGAALGMAVLAPYLGLLTTEGLHIARVHVDDPSPKLEKLPFAMKGTPATQWYAIAAADNRFLCLRRVGDSPDLEVAPFTPDGKPDPIPALTLHADLRLIAHPPGAVFDMVGFGKRAYVAVETPLRGGIVRRVYSVGFDSVTKKAEYRPEPPLAALVGYRLLTFDDALYALNRQTGDMFRFELTTAGRLGPPMRAASAVTRGEEGTGPARSMIKSGLIVPAGHVLVVLNPNEVPSLKELEPFGLHNVLGYEKKGQTTEEPEPDRIPQDLFYNPQKNYWGRCGHDLDVKPQAVGAYRAIGSPRLWVIQSNGDTHTLAVSTKSLFAHDYVTEFPTKPLLPYLNKKRRFSFKYPAAKLLTVISDNYRKLGVEAVSTADPVECGPISNLQSGESVIDINYNEADPSPITLRMLTARGMRSRPDVDYLVELTLSGPDLSTASSCVRRLSINQGWFGNDEVFGSRKEHSTNSLIEVSKPARFDEDFKFVIVNASDRFRVKTSLQTIKYVLTTAFMMINQDYQDFTLEFEGKIATEGMIPVNINYALRPGIETSSGTRPQNSLIRLNTDRAQKIQVLLVKMLMPGDQPLKLKGSEHPIEPLRQGPVFVCQLDYKM